MNTSISKKISLFTILIGFFVTSCASMNKEKKERFLANDSKNVVLDIFCIDIASLQEPGTKEENPRSVVLKNFETSSLVFFKGRMYQQKKPFLAMTKEGPVSSAQIVNKDFKITFSEKQLTDLFTNKSKRESLEISANIEDLKNREVYRSLCYGHIDFRN